MSRKTITISAPTSYKCWEPPSFARLEAAPSPRQEGFKELVAVPVKELPKNVLDALAEAWLEGLYARAGRKSPGLGS